MSGKSLDMPRPNCDISVLYDLIEHNRLIDGSFVELECLQTSQIKYHTGRAPRSLGCDLSPNSPLNCVCSQ